LTGINILQADVATIWPMLQDEEILARISPGVSRIEKVNEDLYRAISDISIGPVRGSFEGELSLVDKIQHETMTLVLAQKSKIGNAEAKIVMTLLPQETGHTEIVYDGTAKVSGRLATMGQRILGGVISTLSKQVFKELERVIKERTVTQAPLISDDHPSQSVPPSVEVNPNADTVKSATASDDISAKEHSRQATNTTSEIRKSFFQLIIDKLKSLWK